MTIRKPVVAGSFYPGSKTELEKVLSSLLDNRSVAEPGFGGLAPHAGYVYSGTTAASLFNKLKLNDTIILLGPKHNYAGAEYAVSSDEYWETPLGKIVVDEKLADKILSKQSPLILDKSAHAPEHSLEVLIPFIQYINPAAKILPIALGAMNENTRLNIATALTNSLVDSDNYTILISSDMSHFVTGDIAREMDMLAIEQILNLDPVNLITTVTSKRISMCGLWPAAVGITALKSLGATQGNLINYSNSGDVSGDYSSVVGYAAIKFD